MPDDEQEEEELRKPNKFWGALSNVHIAFKIVAGILLFLYFMYYSRTEGNVLQLLVVIGITLAILYLLGRSEEVVEPRVITPEEAERLARKEIERKKKDGQFSYDFKYYLGPNIIPQKVDYKIKEYWIGLATIEHKKLSFKQVRVDAILGYATIQDTTTGPLRGTEVQDYKNIIPEVFRFANEYGIKEWLR